MLVQSDYLYFLFAVIFLMSILFSMLINRLMLKFSTNLGMRKKDTLQEVRWSSTSKPALGGISFFIVFLISVSLLGALPTETPEVFDLRILGIVTASILGFLLGLADDAYNTNPLVKFMGQLTCAFILITTGVSIELTGVYPVDFIFTIVWVIGLMNSINMLDNMDAITTSVSISIILGTICILAFMGNYNSVYMVLLIGVLGALAGFLYFNWNPSSMYMGDTGSQFLGVYLAAISIIFMWNDFKASTAELIQIKQFIIPGLLFIVPLVDTTTVTFRRLMRKQSPFVGGKDHITHQLAILGMSDRMVAVTLGSLSLTSVVIVCLLVSGVVDWTYQVTIGLAVYFFAVLFGMQVLYNKAQAKLKAKEAA
jgi:UDP-GlcNAc:undecaprenyl-phosphate GlcNAc-1-phosphate transferase